MSYTINYKSSNGKDNIYARIWDCENPSCILQISHGMVEHIDRYDDFAKFLNSKNILVAGNNHLGHGPTARKLGYFGEGPVEDYLIEDVYSLSNYLKEKYNLPLYYLGHSMGSFITRYLISKYKSKKVILIGTGYISQGEVKLLNNLSKASIKVFGENYKSKLLLLLSLGAYQIKAPLGESWISFNKDNLQRRKEDKYCSFSFTDNGYLGLSRLLKKIIDKDVVSKTDKDTSLLLLSGKEDPVGDKTKGVKKVYKLYKDLGYKVDMKFFANMSHEILNEDNNIEVYQEVYNFIKE